MRLTIFLLDKIRKAAKVAQRFEGLSPYTHPSPVSLGELLEFGRNACEKKSFMFLREEMPVRLSHIMREFKDLPDTLLSMSSVKLVRSWYEQSFNELQMYKHASPDDPDILMQFSENARRILNRHAHVVETIAQGVIEMEETYGIDSKLSENLQYFLDRFYMNRISMRMLLTQHASLFGNHPTNSRCIGNIDPNCDVLEVVQIAFSNARRLCEQYYLTAPDLNITVSNPHEEEERVNIVYIPGHLEHMLFEIIKNAMRAVVEHHAKETDLPPLNMVISKGKEDLTIKLSDKGGGVPYSKKDLLFQYMYTTAPRPQYVGGGGGPSTTPLAGYGYGLPLSRLYARYLQGDLAISSVEGYGTDAFIYLKVNSDEANECLPIYNTTTSRMYESDVVISDWSSPKPWTQARNFSTICRPYPYSTRHYCTVPQRQFPFWNSSRSIEVKS